MVIIHGWSKPKNCRNCPFNESDCRCYITKSEIDRDDYSTQDKCPIDEEQSITLLKKQEPILLENQHKPYGISTNANSPWVSRCPRCGKKVEGKQTRFCKYCGQAVKWNDEC